MIGFILQSRSVRLVAVVALLMAGVMVWTSPASVLACTPPAGGVREYNFEERVERAPVVLVGTVLEVQSEVVETGRQIATVQVAGYYKGEAGPTLVSIRNFGPSSLCLSTVSVGGPYVFFVEGNAAEGYSAYYAGQGDAIVGADERALEALLGVQGTVLATPDPSLPPSITLGGPFVPAQGQGTDVGFPGGNFDAPPPVLTMTAEATLTGVAPVVEGTSDGPPVGQFDAPPPVLTMTAEAQINAVVTSGPSNPDGPELVSSPVQTLIAEEFATIQANTPSTSTSNSDDEGINPIIPFAIGFVVASVLWLIGGYWYLNQEVDE